MFRLYWRLSCSLQHPLQHWPTLQCHNSMMTPGEKYKVRWLLTTTGLELAWSCWWWPDWRLSDATLLVAVWLQPTDCPAVQGLPDHALQWFKVPLASISSFSWREGGKGQQLKSKAEGIEHPECNNEQNSYKTAVLSKHLVVGEERGRGPGDRGWHKDLASCDNQHSFWYLWWSQAYKLISRAGLTWQAAAGQTKPHCWQSDPAGCIVKPSSGIESFKPNIVIWEPQHLNSQQSNIF